MAAGRHACTRDFSGHPDVGEMIAQDGANSFGEFADGEVATLWLPVEGNLLHLVQCRRKAIDHRSRDA